MHPLENITGRLARSRRSRRRSRRGSSPISGARDQDRASRRRRLRARLRHAPSGTLELLRLAESIEGVADARRQNAGRRGRSRACSSAPTYSCRTSRRARPIVPARRLADLCARHSRSIVCTVSGYGSTGPYAAKKAYDLLVAERGRIDFNHRHRRTSGQSWNFGRRHRRGMYAYSGILTALLMRTTTGRGVAIDVSLSMRSASGCSTPRTTPATADRRRREAAPITRRSRRTDRFARPTATRCISGSRTRASGPRCAPTSCDARSWPTMSGSRPTRRGSGIARRPAPGDRVGASQGSPPSRSSIGLETARIACARMNSVDEYLAHPQLGGPQARHRIAGRDQCDRGAAAGPHQRRRAADGRRAGARPAHRTRFSVSSASIGDTIARWRAEGVV